mmetsp:Transcript_34702/g.81016  ORF Transcript_34702/g.81016 Transcript_34702/m.81016 type:complete len:303 (-) Transcript_34702:314-1222(-)
MAYQPQGGYGQQAGGSDMFGSLFSQVANFAAQNPQAASQAAQQGYQFAQKNPELANQAINAGVQQAAGQNQGGSGGMMSSFFGGQSQQQPQQQQAPQQQPQQGKKPGLFGLFGGSSRNAQDQGQQQMQNAQNQANQYGQQAQGQFNAAQQQFQQQGASAAQQFQQQGAAFGQQMQAQGAAAQNQASSFFGGLFGGAGGGLFVSAEQQAAENYGKNLLQMCAVLDKYNHGHGQIDKEEAKRQCQFYMDEMQKQGGQVNPQLVDEYLRSNGLDAYKRMDMKKSWEELNQDTSVMGRARRMMPCC